MVRNGASFDAISEGAAAGPRERPLEGVIRCSGGWGPPPRDENLCFL